MDDQTEQYVRMLREQLAMLEAAYREAAAPIIRRLVEIESLRRPPPWIELDAAKAADLRRRLER